MKHLFIAVMLLTLASCYEPNVKKESTNDVISPEHRPLTIVNIDGCQYLLGDWGRESIFTHKGNCNNPIHKSK